MKRLFSEDIKNNNDESSDQPPTHKSINLRMNGKEDVVEMERVCRVAQNSNGTTCLPDQ